ncbi:pleckstrin homology domain-containing family A member 6 [Menidia menidia]
MLKFRVDRRASQHDPCVGAVTPLQREEALPIHFYLQRLVLDLDLRLRTVGSQRASMVSDLSPEAQSHTWMSRTPRKAATFGKRSNSLRRNPKAEISKQGWLSKQASSGVKQWNRRWFVLTDRCLFYYKDEKEDSVLGSLPLLSFRIGAVEPSDNINRRFAFKVFSEEEEEEEGEEGKLKAPIVSCIQAKHAGTRTYYFSSDSHEEQRDWIRAMSQAAEVASEPAARTKADTSHPSMEAEAPTPTNEASTAHSSQGGASRDQPRDQTRDQQPRDQPRDQQPRDQHPRDREQPRDHPRDQQPRDQQPRDQLRDHPKDQQTRDHPRELPRDQHPRDYPRDQPRDQNPRDQLRDHPRDQPRDQNPRDQLRDHPMDQHPREHPKELPRDHPRDQQPRDQQENVVFRRGFVPRTTPERVAQRRSSMAQLQQWVNQRRGMNSQEDLSSPASFYRGVPDFYRHSGGSLYLDEFPPLYSAGLRPDSVCSASPLGGPDPPWGGPDPPWGGAERRSLRDGMFRDSWGPQLYSGLEPTLRRLAVQPRSRSVPRSPSLSSGGHYSPAQNFASPARSNSNHFDRFGARMREEGIYADPFAYSLRRSVSSPKYVYPGDRRSLSQGLYHHSYPVSPSIHMKAEDFLDLQLQRNLDYLDQQVPAFHHASSRELHPTLKLNEIETSKLLGRLCEQSRILKDHEAVVHRLRMDKDSLEDELVATHQEMELYRNQPLIIEKLLFKKETQQNHLINVRGELSQASSALTTIRMEFEALEDEAHAIHGDLWEQLNAGVQSELVRRHIQKEFWRVQDVLEGLHKSNSSRGTDTAKHRVASGASGSFSTNSPASPLSSVSLTSPLSPFSPVPGGQASPTKPLGPEESVPPRPPLPKSYCPLESSPTYCPSTHPLPLDSSAWLHNLVLDDGYLAREESYVRQSKIGDQSHLKDVPEHLQPAANKVGIVPPRTKSPSEGSPRSPAEVVRRIPRAHATQERPKSAVFPAELKSKMSVEEQNERLRRHQSSSMRDKRRSLNLSGGQSPANYRVVRRRLTAHEIEIKDLEAAVRGGDQESPGEEIARLRRSQVDDISRELMVPDRIVIPERYLALEENSPLSPEEQKEKQKKVDRIKTLIAKSNLQNVVPLLDGPVEPNPTGSRLQLQEQEKRIEISCALAAEASRRSRLLSAQCASSPPMSPTSLVPPPSSSDFPSSAHVMKV